MLLFCGCVLLTGVAPLSQVGWDTLLGGIRGWLTDGSWMAPSVPRAVPLLLGFGLLVVLPLFTRRVYVRAGVGAVGFPLALLSVMSRAPQMDLWLAGAFSLAAVAGACLAVDARKRTGIAAWSGRPRGPDNDGMQQSGRGV